nr:MAG TPA: hypothetical protein [Caudoviricetes sp.]
MASDFLKQYAKSSREKIDREYGKKAYGGSKYKMDKVWGQTATQDTAAKQKPVTKPISEPVPQKKKENISFWEKLLNAFGDAGYSADTTTPLALTNQAISDDYRKSNMQESKTAEAGGNIAKSAYEGAKSAYENAAGTFLNKRSGTQIMGVTVADNAVPQEDKDKAEAARKRNQESIYAKADKAAAAAAEASEKAKDNLGGSKAAGAFVDIASGGLQLGADMALNALLPGVGLANMGLRSYGSGSREARLDGASEGEQVAYGAAAAAVDVLTEKIFDVGKLFGGGAADDVAEKLIGKLAKTDAGRSVVRALTNAVGEGAEEAVADILNPAIRAIYDKGAAAKSSYTTAEGAKEMLAQSAYDAMIGAVLSTFGTAAGIAKGIDAQKNAALRAGEPAASVNAEASAKPAEAENIAAEAQAEAAPVETAQVEDSQATVRTLLKKGIISNSEANRVLADAGLRTEFERQTGETLTGTKADQRAQIKRVTLTQNITGETAKSEEQSQKTGEIVNESAENAVEAQNSDNFADVQQREAETDAGQRGTLPEGQGAKSAEFGYDEARTQTHSTDGVLTDDERAMQGLRPEDRTHKVNHDEEVNAKAQERFESDYEGEKADLFGTKQDWDDTDTVLAHKIIVKEVAKARESGSKDAYAEVAKLMKEWDAHGTEAGQALRQRRQFASDPALMEADAIQLLSDSERTRKMSDEQRKKILDSVSQNAEKLRSIEKGDVDGVVDLIKGMSTERRTNGLWSNKMGRTMEKALEQAKKLPGGEAFLRDVAASQVRGIAYDYAKPSTLEQIKAYRYLSMLSKPATPGRNLVGNMVYDPVEAVSNNIGVGLDMLLSKYTGTRSVAADKSYFSKTKRKGMGEATLKSYIETGLDASVSNAQGKYETGGSRSFKMTGNFLERFLSTWEKYSNYAMVTTDQMQKGGIQAEAQRGIDALEAKGKVAKGALDGRAEEIARERTFQNEGKLAQATGVVRRALNVFSIKDKRGGSFGVGDLILPFTNVPGNIASAAIQYSPAGFINAGAEVVKVLNKAKAGTLTASEQAKAVTDFGRAFNGTMGIAFFAVLAGAGIMNVSGDDDKDKEALEKSEGVSGTQLNLSALNRWIAGESTEWRDGDDLVSIGFLDPINAQMTYGALLADCYKDEGLTFANVAGGNLESAFQSVMDLPAMSQFQEIENSLKYSKADTTGGKLADATFRYGASQATSFVPNVVSGVAQGVDGTVRDTYNGDTVWENSLSAMKSKIPGLRETLPAALDNWGQEKKYTGTAAENFLNATLNPGSVTKYRTSAVNQELYRLGENIDIKYPEKKAPNSGNRDGEKVSLDQDERRQYQMAYGQTAYDNIQKVIRSSVYKQSSDAEKAAAIQNLLEVATSAGKKKAKLDGGDTPAWTTKSTGTIGENAVYKAMLGTAKDALPEDKRTKTGNVLQSVLKTAGNKRGGDNLMLNIMAQQLSEGTQDKFETAYNGGYELKQIVDFYQAKYATKPGTSQRKYKKADLYAWAMQNGYTAKQFNQLWKLFS